jgi:hypothetical protein
MAHSGPAIARGALLLAVTAIAGSLLGCASDSERARGYQDGYNVGLAKGRHEGYRTSWEEAYQRAEPEAYDQHLRQLTTEGRFRYHRGILGTVLSAGILLGFGFQYFAFLVLRRQMVLVDVEPILLGRRFAAANLRQRQSGTDTLNSNLAALEEKQSDEAI